MTGGAKSLEVIADDLALNPKQRAFARHIADGKTMRQAAVLAGYSEANTTSTTHISRLLSHPRVSAYIKILHTRNEHAATMSRKKVLDGFLEAIEQAKMMAEPMTQIAGWREIGKLCGYYAPETRNINVNVSSQRMLGQFETLSDVELLEVIDSSATVLQEEVTSFAETLPDANSDRHRQSDAAA